MIITNLIVVRWLVFVILGFVYWFKRKPDQQHWYGDHGNIVCIINYHHYCTSSSIVYLDIKIIDNCYHSASYGFVDCSITCCMCHPLSIFFRHFLLFVWFFRFFVNSSMEESNALEAICWSLDPDLDFFCFFWARWTASDFFLLDYWSGPVYLSQIGLPYGVPHIALPFVLHFSTNQQPYCVQY